MASYSSVISTAQPRRKQPPKSYDLYAGLDFDSDSDQDILAVTSPDATLPYPPHVTQPTQPISRPTRTTQQTQLLGSNSRLTQPTQIISPRPGASARIPIGVGVGAGAAGALSLSSSPFPMLDVEIPASSPFRHQTSLSPVLQKTRPKDLGLGSRIAPAGTAFRPPQLQHLRSPPAPMLKRPAPEPIELSSSDDDDDDHDEAIDSLSHRGDIPRTDFSRRVSQFAHAPGDRVNGCSPRAPAAAPNAFGVMMNRAPRPAGKYGIPTNQQPGKENPDSPVKVKAAGRKRRLVQGIPPHQPLVPPQQASMPPSPSLKPQTQTPIKKSGRLRRGLPPRSSPVSSPWRESPPKPNGDALDPMPILIDSDDDDGGGSGGGGNDNGNGNYKDDNFHAVTDSDSEQDEDKNDDSAERTCIKSRLLSCLNDGSMEDLKAMSRRDGANLKLFVSKRPFNSITQARAVTARKPGSKKAARIHIGDAIVDEIHEFICATNAIDGVVAKCEAKAKQAKREMDIWNLDECGARRGCSPVSVTSPGCDGQPLTPRSLKEYRDPPIPKQPAFMEGHCRMKEFQRFGLNWMNMCYKNQVGCILADEMGLGKTCQVISFMCHLVESGRKKNGVNWPNLIVVPPSTYDNWLAEFEKFTGDNLVVVGYQGSQAARAEIGEEILESPEDYHVILTTYTQVVSRDDREFLRALRPVAAVFDEGHKMKNPETKIYGALRRVQAKWRLLLTGTPVQNNLSEMIALLSFINPTMFGEGADKYLKTMFSSKVSARDVGNSAFLYSERVRRARTILEPFILRRVKQQVIEMPAKVRTIVYCDLPESQRPIYDEYESLFRRGGGGKDAKTRATTTTTMTSNNKTKAEGRGNDQNNIWMQLRKAALHPQLFRRFFDDAKVETMAKILMAKVPQKELQQENMTHLINELKNLSDFELHLWCRDYDHCIGQFDMAEDACLDSGKVAKLLELIGEYAKTGDRLLVFSRFAKMVDILAEVLATSGIAHRVLSGQTSVQERQALIDEFNADTSIPVFLLTTAAGGTGINLTAANKVIIFDQSDNPQDDIQAENRAHRLGQTREVEVIRLIARGTVEELIYKVCEKKIQLANKVTGAAEDEGGDVAAAAAEEQMLEMEVKNMMGKHPTTP